MLETKIAELTAQIETLIAVLKANTPPAAQSAKPVKPAPRAQQPEEPAAPTPAPAPEEATLPPAAAAPEVSIDLLRDMCMLIVRDDQTKKPKVKALIASFAGAQKVQDVPVADREALLAGLRTL